MSAVPCVDWQVAAATGRFLATPGLDVTSAEADAVVADLRQAAVRAVDAIAQASELPARTPSEVLVVGRDSWIDAATDMSRTMLAAVGQQPPSSLGEKVAGRLAGAQLGAAFAFVATRLLGQYDPYSATPRLLLVAPNIVAAERAMGVDPLSFRQWVVLHEQTHRAQFAAAGWLPQHLLGLMRTMFDESDHGAPRPSAPRPRPFAGLLSPAQQSTLDRITAVMSLLEGHADVMMDRAAPGLVPQVDVLRARMEARRDAAGLVQVISRLLGLRAKREQYLHGASFCRAVLDEAGIATLNQAFTAPASLPTLSELHDPLGWLRRVSVPVG
ncbi:MAG: zinc-dependent metalloprotease [Micropruina sp.]|nr:zinc-dependent metalloprotease [Micropruina sp.]